MTSSNTSKARSAKSYHENFAKFFENPTRDGLRDLLEHNVGESRNCDFKAQWPDHSSISKHILGMANSGGGCLVIGVSEQPGKTLDPVGISALEDKADITNGIKKYLPNHLLNLIDIADFSFDASEYSKLVGKRFQVLFVNYNSVYLPFLSLKSGSNIKINAIYIRREGLTEEANYDDLQKLFNARIETEYSTSQEVDLQQHLEQLKVLMSYVSRYRNSDGINLMLVSPIMGIYSGPNPKYPKEDFETFILHMIELKKSELLWH
jgi:predicted HTH transcriptional regulator